MIGIKVWNKKKGTSATYEITKEEPNEVFLKSTHKSGRGTWKSKANLFRDYERFCPCCKRPKRLTAAGCCDDCYI